MNSLEQSVKNGMSAPLVNRTRRVYDRLASVYPLSTALFHSRAHRCALEISGLRDGIGNSGSCDRLWRNVPEAVLLVPRKRSVRHFPRIADGPRGRPQTVVALRVSVAYHGLYVIPIRRRRGLYARKKTGKVRAPGLQLPGHQEQQVLWYVL